MGIVVDSNKPDYVQGDFLVRGLVGADPETGQVAVATEVHPGRSCACTRATPRARTATSTARSAIRMEALGGRRPPGRSCSPATAAAPGCSAARPRRRGDHRRAGGAPAAGFFAAGEIGPVGGEYFLHSFTATVAVFAK